jgi:hypothetical protein
VSTREAADLLERVGEYPLPNGDEAHLLLGHEPRQGGHAAGPGQSTARKYSGRQMNASGGSSKSSYKRCCKRLRKQLTGPSESTWLASCYKKRASLLRYIEGNQTMR